MTRTQLEHIVRAAIAHRLVDGEVVEDRLRALPLEPIRRDRLVQSLHGDLARR